MRKNFLFKIKKIATQLLTLILIFLFSANVFANDPYPLSLGEQDVLFIGKVTKTEERFIFIQPEKHIVLKNEQQTPTEEIKLDKDSFFFEGGLKEDIYYLFSLNKIHDYYQNVNGIYEVTSNDYKIITDFVNSDKVDGADEIFTTININFDGTKIVLSEAEKKEIDGNDYWSFKNIFGEESEVQEIDAQEFQEYYEKKSQNETYALIALFIGLGIFIFKIFGVAMGYKKIKR